MIMKGTVNKSALKRQKNDYQRPLRVVKYFDYPFVLEDSPVELEEGYIVSDRETCDVFASFVFKNVSEIPLKSLKIRLACYLNQNIPYLNIDFEYSQKDLTFGIIKSGDIELKLRDSNKKEYIKTAESFGSCVFIPIPESYFTKMEVILLSAEMSNGVIIPINTLVVGDSQRYNDLDDISKLVYSRVNIYQSAEERFPTKVIPQFSNKVWLCCCGTKNPISNSECEKCGREKEWQKQTVTSDILSETKERMVSDPREVTLHDKSHFAQNKYLETKEETQAKIEQYERAIKNIAYEEKLKQRRQMMIIPKILLFALVLYLLTLLFRIILEFQDPEPQNAIALISHSLIEKLKI